MQARVKQFIFAVRQRRGALVHRFGNGFVHQVHDEFVRGADVKGRVLGLPRLARSRKFGSLPSLSRTSNPEISGKRRSRTTQSKFRSPSIFNACSPDAAVSISISLCSKRARMLNCSAGFVLHHQQPTGARPRIFLDPHERSLQAFRGGRLGYEAKRPARQAVLPVFIQGNDLNRDVPRGGIVLQLTHYRPTQHIRQENIQ